MEGTKALVGALVGSFTLTGRCLHGERSLLLAALSEGSQQDLAAGPSRTSQQDRSDVAGVAQQQDLAGPRSRTAVTPQVWPYVRMTTQLCYTGLAPPGKAMAQPRKKEQGKRTGPKPHGRQPRSCVHKGIAA